MPPLILPNAAATFGLPLLACPLLPCSILTVLRVGLLIPRFGVSTHGPKHSVFTKTPWRAVSTGYWSWVVEASSFGSCFLLCISEALDFWWLFSFHDHSLVKVLTEFHLRSNAKVGETHCVFALAADMTLSHIFFWGSKEERVNEWSQDALKKKKKRKTDQHHPLVAKHKLYCISMGFPPKGRRVMNKLKQKDGSLTILWALRSSISVHSFIHSTNSHLTFFLVQALGLYQWMKQQKISALIVVGMYMLSH